MFKKKLAISLIVLFFSSQLYTFFHNAEHDFKAHKHNSVICHVYLNHSKSKDFLNDFKFSTILLDTTVQRNHTFLLVKFFEKQFPTLSPRDLLLF